jgi:hypothetical protein
VKGMLLEIPLLPQLGLCNLNVHGVDFQANKGDLFVVE